MALTVRTPTQGTTQNIVAPRVGGGARSQIGSDAAPIEEITQWQGIAPEGEGMSTFDGSGAKFQRGPRQQRPPDYLTKVVTPSVTFAALLSMSSHGEGMGKFASMTGGSKPFAGIISSVIAAYEKTSEVIGKTAIEPLGTRVSLSL